MAETRKFSDELRSATDYLAFQQAIPDTTNADGNGGACLAGKAQGALEIAVRAYETIALTGTLTIKLKASATEGGSYVDIPGCLIAKVNPATVAGDEVCRFAIPRTANPWIKVNIASSATASGGKLNIYPAYVAR